MKTEKEILEKYNEMLKSSEKLHNIVLNPTDNMSFEDIKQSLYDDNCQFHMNALIEWVLDIDSNKRS